MERRRRHRNLVNWLNQGGQHAIHAQSRNGSSSTDLCRECGPSSGEDLDLPLVRVHSAGAARQVRCRNGDRGDHGHLRFQRGHACHAQGRQARLLRRGGAGRLYGRDHGGRRHARHHRRGRARQLRQHRAEVGGRALRSGPHALDPLSVGLDQLLGEPGRLCGRHQRHQHHLRPAGGGEGQDQRPGLPGRSHVAWHPSTSAFRNARRTASS